MKSLRRLFIESARKNWARPTVSDTTGKDLTCGKVLIASILLGNELKKICGDQDKVGVILPATVGGVLSNTAITMLGKIPVNLNFTSGAEIMESAIKQCDIRTIVSSKAFVAKLGDAFSVPEGTVYLEDIMPRITTGAKIVALLKAKFAPCAMLANDGGFKPDDLATIVFSSGTTGDPKGVMLSHKNIISNMKQFGAVLPFTYSDSMCAALPFFHSFGFTCTLWFPLIQGFRVCFHPNPLDGEKIAEVVRENACTVLLATPTFLLAYIRRATKDDFKTLTHVITGAEKLRARVAEAFEKKFGIVPLEGYGVTETAPVVSLNLPPDTEEGREHLRTKRGTIGRAVPGVSVKIVHQDEGHQLPSGEDGLLHVKGDNVMLGYLGRPEETAAVLKDGWYNTGDIAHIDKDGFMTITDRASRFSKIGGEMVPHIAVEEVFLGGLDTDGRVVIVASVPDDRKGERLVVLHTDEAGSAEKLHDIMSKSDLPNLWRPRPDDYIRIDAIPVLGSGKVDLKSVRQMARDIAV